MKFNSSRQKGFTLIEVMISMAVLGIIMAGLPAVFASYTKFNTLNERRSEALVAAQQVLDELRIDDPAGMPTSGTDPAELVAVNDRQYEVFVTYCEEASYCTALTNRHLKVQVEYAGRVLYEVETVFTRLR